MKGGKSILRSLQLRMRKLFNPTFFRERWLAKHALKTSEGGPAGSERCVGGLAAIPSREAALALMVDSVIGQLDHLYVYLNGFDHVPHFLKNEKITVFRSQDSGDLGDVGKFFGAQFAKSGIYFTLDDDIIYPPDYRSRMVACLRQFDYKAAIGVHGAFYSWNPASFFDRQVIHYRAENKEIRPVSILGTGTVCFSLDHFNVELDWFRSANMADIWFGGQLKRRGFPALCIDRGVGWLQDADAASEQPESKAIYEMTRLDPEPYNRALSGFLPWGRSDIARRISGHPSLLKRYADMFSVTDFSSLIARCQDESLAEREFLHDLAKFSNRKCAEQDVIRYFDSYECELWSKLLVKERRPDFVLAIVVLKRALPVATEKTAECAEQLMHSAEKHSDRRSLLRAALIYMRAMQRMELFDAIERAYKYISAIGKPSVQISLEYLSALLSQGRPREAYLHYQSSSLHTEHPALNGLIEWLRDPEQQSAMKLISSYLDLEKSGLMRAFRSNVFKWVSTAQSDVANQLSEGDVNRLVSIIENSSNGISAIKLLVEAGAHSAAAECYRKIFYGAHWKYAETMEFQLLGAFVAKSGQEVVERLNTIYAKHELSLLTLTDAGSGAGNFFRGLTSPEKKRSDKELGKVSVIMTCRNASSTISYAIESILSQTYKDVELIIVDDGSEDSTRDIINTYRESDSRVFLIKNDSNIGIYASRNRAIRFSSGEFVAFQDADDYSHPQRIELQVTELCHADEAVAVNSGHIRVSSEGEICLENNLNVFGHGPVNWIYRRGVFDQIGLFKEVRTRGDIEFIKRILVHYKQSKVITIELPLLLALHDLKTNSRVESEGEKVRRLIKQREMHARQHYVARHLPLG